MRALTRNRILIGDAAAMLATLPAASVDCVITSPPYFLQRSYGVDGQIGSELTVTAWVARMLPVFTGLARVLKPSGSVWVELIDTYSGHEREGAPRKGLLLAPERLMLALADHGWSVRQKIVWHKTNPLPRAVRDRFTDGHSSLYHLVRSSTYYFDRDAAREILADSKVLLGTDPGTVWSIGSRRGWGGFHPATFPEALVERPLLSTCPEKVCTRCGQPWQREYHALRLDQATYARSEQYQLRFPERYKLARRPGRLVPCSCGASALPGVVLDPFFGSGTVGAVAQRFGRDWLGIELNQRYAKLAGQRLGDGTDPPARRAA